MEILFEWSVRCPLPWYLLQKSLAFSEEEEKSNLACAEAGIKGRSVAQGRASSSEWNCLARAVCQGSSLLRGGGGGHRLVGGFLGIQMKFDETALCFLACTGTNYSMAKELMF